MKFALILIENLTCRVNSLLPCKKASRMTDPEFKLYHFNTRFLAEPIRFIMAYADIPYEDVRVAIEDWSSLKDKLPFQQLPVLELSDGRTLCQSSAICRYLADLYQLTGKDEWEAAKCNEISDHFRDMRQEWRKVFFESDLELKIAAKHNYLEKVIPRFFNPIEAELQAEGRDCLVGDTITWIDLLLATTVGFFEDTIDPEVITPYPAIRRIKNKIWGHPKIRAWLARRPKPNLKILRQIPLTV